MLSIICWHRLSPKHVSRLFESRARGSTAHSSISAHLLVICCTVRGRRIPPRPAHDEIWDGATSSGSFINIVLLSLSEARLVCCLHKLIVRRGLLGASGLLKPYATINAYRSLLLALRCGRSEHRFPGEETRRSVMRIAQSICRLIIFHH